MIVKCVRPIGYMEKDHEYVVIDEGTYRYTVILPKKATPGYYSKDRFEVIKEKPKSRLARQR